MASYVRRISSAQEQRGHTVHQLEMDALTRDGANSLVATIQELGIQLLHTHFHLASGIELKVPRIHTVHGHWPYCPSGSRFLGRQAQPCDRAYSVAGCLHGHLIDRCGSARPANIIGAFRNTQAVIRDLRATCTVVVSDFIRQQMLRHGYSPHLVHVLHLPAPDVQRYVPPPVDTIPQILFLGRIVPQKGVTWLLHSMKHVRVPVHLHIAGTGWLQQSTQELADALGLHDRVTFHGWVDEDQTANLLVHARAVVVPSLWHEPGATVIAESKAFGRAVIASRVGGIPELVIETGLLVAPNNVRELVAAIERLACDWSLAQQLGSVGYRQARDVYSLQHHIDMLDQLYAERIASRPTAPVQAHDLQGDRSRMGS
jgi:glycosyltransferase involved in cell wall biosynthesis